MRTILSRLVLGVILFVVGADRLLAQQPPAASPDSAVAVPPPQPVAPPPPTPAPSGSSLADRIYYGGTVTLSFSNAFRIGIAPLIGYKLTPKLSLGAQVGYEYVNYDNVDTSAHNYGASVFSRYRLVPALYAHAEYRLFSYDFVTSRETVPFLLVGGGVSKLIAPRTWAFVEVLVDVLQDENSPYDDWEPVLNIGVGVGF